MNLTENSMIEVLTAFRDGKDLEYRNANDSVAEWAPAPTPCWDFATYEYRIKPSPPKPREWWIVIPTAVSCNPPAFSTPAGAENFLHTYSGETIHVREVLPDEEGKA